MDLDQVLTAVTTCTGSAGILWCGARALRRPARDNTWIAQIQRDEDELRGRLDIAPIDRGREETLRRPARTHRRPLLPRRIIATAADLRRARRALTAAPRALTAAPRPAPVVSTRPGPRVVVGEVVAATAGPGPAGPSPLYLSPRRPAPGRVA